MRNGLGVEGNTRRRNERGSEAPKLSLGDPDAVTLDRLAREAHLILVSGVVVAVGLSMLTAGRDRVFRGAGLLPLARSHRNDSECEPHCAYERTGQRRHRRE